MHDLYLRSINDKLHCSTFKKVLLHVNHGKWSIDERILDFESDYRREKSQYVLIHFGFDKILLCFQKIVDVYFELLFLQTI